MPSRKQRRKRDKERRHEYELILVDEEGEERPIDPDELRAKRREKESASKGKGTGKSGKAQPARGSSSRPIREVKPPSWDRVVKRTALFGVFMFLVLSFVPSVSGGQHTSVTSRLAPTVLYTVLFAPLLYMIDRVQYRTYLKRTGQEPPAPSSGSRGPAREKPADDGATGLAATLRRAFRR